MINQLELVEYSQILQNSILKLLKSWEKSTSTNRVTSQIFYQLKFQCHKMCLVFYTFEKITYFAEKFHRLISSKEINWNYSTIVKYDLSMFRWVDNRTKHSCFLRTRIKKHDKNGGTSDTAKWIFFELVYDPFRVSLSRWRYNMRLEKPLLM